jgi:hypothetical protein
LNSNNIKIKIRSNEENGLLKMIKSSARVRRESGESLKMKEFKKMKRMYVVVENRNKGLKKGRINKIIYNSYGLI